MTETSLQPKVLLISMPWASVTEPSLGLGILKAQLLAHGIPCIVRHQNIFLLKYFRPESYETIGARWGLNDFLFTRVLEGKEIAPDQLDALATMVRNTYRLIDLQAHASTDPQPFIEHVTRIRNDVIPDYLEDSLELVDAVDASMIGFTCMYDQTFASLALAKLIKQKYPQKLIVFGGYALEGPVGPQILRCFDFVDVVVLGEGENKIVPLAKASVDRSMLEQIPNILYRDEQGRICGEAITETPIALDDSPIPNYDDFFFDVNELSRDHDVDIKIRTLPVESSRGCWWGQVSHCTFCGIDDITIAYRAKTPQRVESILETLTNTYGQRLFRFSDYILPRQYYKTLLPELAKKTNKYLLHWEMKANVKNDEVELMSSAGVIAAQPGIESFSSSVLRKMSKGVSGIQNVLTVKLLTQHNIIVNYNILFGFPTDEASEYRQLVENIPRLYHLPPPYSYIPVQVTRFAPMQVHPERFGITAPLIAESAYETILSRAYRQRVGFELTDYCYVFATPYEFDSECSDLYNMLVYQVAHWISLHANREVRLSYETTDQGIDFFDTRYSAEPRTLHFGCEHALVYDAIGSRIASKQRLAAELADTIDQRTVFEILDEFDAERLVYEEEGRVVGLAFPANCYKTWEQLRNEPLLGTLDDQERLPVLDPTLHLSYPSLSRKPSGVYYESEDSAVRR